MFSLSLRGLRAGQLALVLAVVVPTVGYAAEQAQTPRNLNDKTVEVFTKIRPLAETKNYSAMMALLAQPWFTIQ